MNETVREMVVIEQRRIAAQPYERAIVEKELLPDGRRALRVFPVDGTEILDEEGHVVLCWNGLGPLQQKMLRDGHNGPPVRDKGNGWCTQAATVLVETVDDETPGPRFYCLVCAIDRLTTILKAEGRQRFMQERSNT